jgi:hypothetical protein
MAGQNIEKRIREAAERGPIIIYGAHLVALELYRYLKYSYENLEFAGFVVSSASDNPCELEGESVTELRLCKADKNVTIIIAMPEKHHDTAEASARGFGFFWILKVGLEEMSQLKGKQILADYKKSEDKKFQIYQDEYDVSWLNISDALNKSVSINDLEIRHYKFPTIYYRDSESVYHETEKFKFYEDYERVFGEYHNLHALPVYTDLEDIIKNDTRTSEMMHIYMVYSQWDSGKLPGQDFPSWIRPVQAGSVFSKYKMQTYLDETGDSISGENGLLAEMTAAYWIWKNAEPAEYKGLCHYRRHFIITEAQIRSMNRNGVDVILTTPRYVPGGIGRMFLEETPVKKPVLQNMIEAVARCCQEDRKPLEDYLEECLYCPNNMVIARGAIYDAYCKWIFPILFQMLKSERENGYGHEKDRHIAYAAELLTSYFFAKHKDDYFIAMTDYRFIVDFGGVR